MTTIYVVIVLPYKHIQKRRGVTVFGDEPATKARGECMSDIPESGAQVQVLCQRPVGGAVHGS